MSMPEHMGEPKWLADSVDRLKLIARIGPYTSHRPTTHTTTPDQSIGAGE